MFFFARFLLPPLLALAACAEPGEPAPPLTQDSPPLDTGFGRDSGQPRDWLPARAWASETSTVTARVT